MNKTLSKTWYKRMNKRLSKIMISVWVILALCSWNVFAQELENWSRFRGPNGQGVSAASDLPLQWSAEENIAWKTEIPGEGWSSPVIWNDHIFLTSAAEEGKNCHVIAVSRKTGKILWDKMVFTQEPQFKHPKNSFATPTPVTDGLAVYAVFGSGGFIALDFNGNKIWSNQELHYYSQHGLGTSPILYHDLLVIAINPSNREEPKRLGWQDPWDQSYLLALDKKTGQERWRGKRGMSKIGHATPAIIQVDGKDQIVSPVGDVIQGFDPVNGKLIWTIKSPGEPVVPSPAIGDGLVYTAPMPSDAIRAVRTNGTGDCTETHIAWEQKRNVPKMASFLYVKPCLYAANDNGSFSAYDAETGEFLWQKRLSGALNPSPLYADGKIYVLSELGTTTVLKPAANPKEPPEIVAENELGEHTLASMAVAGKQLFIRTDHHLWCIGK
ncbi:MAG: PQQ-binding-like beta-propeller repeat protein [Planctomycetaceae bacterium]|jgi:outer membrane protein assembly factor BamB|nr:PQQ-binding-like beta-propeller repeat protein [Planctomycetaceae bacterium]